MTALSPYRKAIFGALLAGLGALLVALEDGGVSATDWVKVVTAVVVVLAGVYAVPNEPTKPAD